MDDFLLSNARFQIPQIDDLEKWGNRVVKNLLYYQTNYFVMAAAVFAIIGLFHPGKICVGIALAFGSVYGFSKFFCDTAPGSTRPNIYVVCGGIAAISYLILYILDALLIVAFAILLPVSLIFVHSSLRLRNLSNKLTNTLEIVSIKHSPMGKFLESLGLMPDTF